MRKLVPTWLVCAFLAGTAAPAFAEEGTTTPPPSLGAPPALAPSNEPPPLPPSPTSPALISPSPRFGMKRTVVVGSDFAANGLAWTKNPGNIGKASQTSIYLAPSLSYFLLDNLSLSGRLVFSKTSTSTSTTPSTSTDDTGLGLGVGAGYVFWLAARGVFWPQASLVYFHGSPGKDTAWDAQLDVFAPFCWMPVDNFFGGIGPAFDTQLVAKFNGKDLNDKESSLGIRFVLGGYFDP